MYDDESDRGDKIRTCGLCVPNAALYQTEPRLDISYTIIRIFYFVNHYFSYRYCSGGIFLPGSAVQEAPGPPDVENWTKIVLQASLTSVFVQFAPPREL